jgi:CHAT domain-containing protein
MMQEDKPMKALKWLLAIPLLIFSVGCAQDQSGYLATARYSELEKHMESQVKDLPSAKTHELWALCYSYSMLKEYNKLFPCLDQLDSNIARGDTKSRPWGYDLAPSDVSAGPPLLRAEADIGFGNYGAAVEQATKAYDIMDQKRDVGPWLKIQVLSTLALSHALKGNRAKAEEYARLLADVNTASSGLSVLIMGPGAMVSSTLLDTEKKNGLARMYMAMGDFQRSLSIIKEPVGSFIGRTARSRGPGGQEARRAATLPEAFILNKCLYETGQIQEAKAGYDKLLAIPQTKDNGDIYWMILFDRGKIAEAEGNLKEAIDFYQRAIDVIERQRSTINTEASKIGYVGNKQQVYHSLIRALFTEGQPVKAFEYVERSKSRALVDLLASKKDFAAPGINPQQVALLLEDLEAHETKARVQSPEAAAGARSARDFQVKLRTMAPELASLVAVAPVAAANIQALLQPDEALVEYYYEGDDLYAFIVTREAVKGVKLNGAHLVDEIRQLRAALKQPHSQLYVTPSEKLYDRLIKPLEASLNHKELLIVAHGVLHYLPFNALQGSKEYLIDRYSLRQLPSASVLQFLKGRQGSPSPGVLALGNPDLGNRKYDLKYAQDEAVAIAKGFPQAKVLVRQDATKTAFKTLAPQFPYLHFATHGIFDPDEPLKSGLLLAKDAESDGFLSLGELYSLRLNADLVTLSACETGLGKISNGDDVVGLTRGFLYAGSNTIVASLWEVDDQATSYLMEEFYANLKKSNKREALRQAQLATKKKYEHPYYWAAFELTGEI